MEFKMKLNELHPPKGAVKDRKRKGQGPGSGNGKTAGRGEKGQKARSGYSAKWGFEGGQMPLIRRIPKRGFKNFNKKVYQVVNVEDLNIFKDGDIVRKENLKENDLISSLERPVKLLGDGELEKKVEIYVDKCSKKAKEIVEKKGGKVYISEKKKSFGGEG